MNVLSCTISLLLLTNTYYSNTELTPRPLTLPTLYEETTYKPTNLILIEQAELDALADFGKKCQGALVSCAAQIQNLETYVIHTENQIEELSKRLVEEEN